jgi:hypothetical protein
MFYRGEPKFLSNEEDGGAGADALPALNNTAKPKVLSATFCKPE